MADFTQRPLEDIPFKTDDESKINLPRDMAIRRIVLRFVLEVVNGGSLPVNFEDDILNILKKIRIVRNGSNVKFDMTGRMMFFTEKNTKGTTPDKTDLPTTISTTVNGEVTLAIDFATNRQNQRDTSALLKTRGPRLSSLTLGITFGNINDVQSANAGVITVANSKVEVEIEEVTGTTVSKGANVDVNTPDYKPVDYIETTRTIDLENSAKTSFDNDTQKENVIPAPANLVANGFMVVDDSTGAKDDTFITSLKIQRESPFQKRIIQRTWLSARKENKAEHSLEVSSLGFLYWDYVDVLGIGLINNGAEGDVKYRFLKIATVSDRIELYTKSFAVAALT